MSAEASRTYGTRGTLARMLAVLEEVETEHSEALAAAKRRDGNKMPRPVDYREELTRARLAHDAVESVRKLHASMLDNGGN